MRDICSQAFTNDSENSEMLENFLYEIVKSPCDLYEMDDEKRKINEWLLDANLIHRIYKHKCLNNPPRQYLFDTGLILRLLEKPIDTLNKDIKGIFFEGYAAQQLAQHNEILYYWDYENSAEVDFLFQHQGASYPIEIKSKGNDHKSLDGYIESDKQIIGVYSHGEINLRFHKEERRLDCPIYLLSELPRFLDMLNISS